VVVAVEALLVERVLSGFDREPERFSLFSATGS